jgi:hypothetical protein
MFSFSYKVLPIWEKQILYIFFYPNREIDFLHTAEIEQIKDKFLSFRETSHEVESSALSLIEDEVTISEGLKMDQLSPQPITFKTSQLSVIEYDGTATDKSVRMDTLSPTGRTPKTHQVSINEDDRTVVEGELRTEIRRRPVDLDTECELESSFLYQYPTGTGNKQPNFSF